MTWADRSRARIAQLWATQTDGAHDMGHLDRVWRACRLIAMDEPADPDILGPAAYFHDAVNLPKNSPHRATASRQSADLAVAELTAMGYPQAKLAPLHHAILAHSFSANIPPETPEARILQDADRLEALGAIGIARMFLISGQMGGGLFDAADPMALNRPLDDKRFALDHIEVKLVRLVDTMQTATGRAMAAERLEWMESFRTRLLAEIGKSGF
ncbi:hydrolase [Gemmobacter aquarius]|uniref:Hydrolase n=1 Tax=Paragemmobacter aquarius TaxID=2169400 RepID=A0A2S0UJ00_9RHOB|nr:HD domain-containing protein [Gemmobacter aquarius]AWB47765.1 hydrolase [Gemmobacter aquarius]